MSSVSSDSGKTCHLLALPSELQTAIAEELDYVDLKNFAGTCKHNEELIKAKIFDEALFRSQRVGHLEKGASVVMHPILDAIGTLVADDVKEALMWLPDGPDHEFRAIACVDLKASLENATSPPAKTIQISQELTKIGKAGKVTATGDRGVTVKEVIEKAVELWSQPYKGRLNPYLAEDARRSGGKLNIMQVFCGSTDHNAWAGWLDPEVIRRDTVLFTPHWYDS